MLSNLVITNQRIVLIIDELGTRERIAHKFIKQLLSEQGQEESTIKTLPVDAQLKHVARFDEFLTECAKNTTITNQIEDINNKLNVILPTLSDLLCYQRAAVIFDFVNKLRKCTQIKRIFLWASPQHLVHAKSEYILAACEHFAELVLHLETAEELKIITRKPGGGVTNKRYVCNATKSEFNITLKKGTMPGTETTSPKPAVNPESFGTFKIELDEEELVARNALKLPYEKTSETSSGNIIYTPDAADDFDDEDPDEDLCI